MRRKILVLGALATLVLGVLVFAAPPDSHADPFTVTEIIITVGTNVWCAGIAGACAGVPAGGGTLLATFAGAGVLLNPSDTLVLTQTGGTFNFDTSDFCPGGTCAAPTVTVFTNLQPGGVLFTDTGRVLVPCTGTPCIDPSPNITFNEARDWSAAQDLFDIDLSFGYADNLHTDPCADANGTCLPDGPWTGATFFFGAGASGGGLGVPDTISSNHCAANDGSATCFDSGAILIHNSQQPPTIPEPSTLLLLGTGLLGMAAYGRRRLKKNS